MKPTWQAEGVELYLGDCLEILPTLSGVDAVVTDPPYGINFPYRSYNDTRENLVALIANVMPEISRITTNAYILCGPTQTRQFLPTTAIFPRWLMAHLSSRWHR